MTISKLLTCAAALSATAALVLSPSAALAEYTPYDLPAFHGDVEQPTTANGQVIASTSPHIDETPDGDKRGGVGIKASGTITVKATTTRSHEEGDDKGRVATSTSKHEDGDNDEDEDEDIEVDHDSALHATSTIQSEREVTNRGQLRSFLNHVVKGDDNAQSVVVSSTTVQTTYQLPAKFLWAIPTTLPANVTVNASGTVTVSYPWYGFLYSKKDKELKTELEGVASTTASTTLSVSVQAHLINALFSVLKDNAD